MGAWPVAAGARTALVTGAGNGIGAAVSEALATRGWNLALVDLDLEAAEAVAARIGPRGAAYQANITDQGSVDAAVDSAAERFGGIDLCFANAGIAAEGTLRHTDPDVFAVQIDVNLIGTFRTIHACLPHLMASRGYLMINSSASALMAPPGLGAYGASKAALESLGDTLRRELRHHGVDVGVVYLLWVATDLVEGAEAHGEIFRTIRSSFTGPLAKAMPVDRAVAAIVRGIEGRRRRVTRPWIISALYRLRGVAPALLERDAVRMAPDVEAATERDIASKGALEAALRTDTAAASAAADKART